MVSFKKPTFTFDFNFSDEVNFLLSHKNHRGIPDKNNSTLLLATWNVANLGMHERGEDHYRLIAEMMSWFDIIAVQEVHDDLTGLYAIEQFIGSEYELMFNDKGGNDERSAYFYDTTKVERLQLTGELAIPPAKHRHIKLPNVRRKFTGFDRNPFIGTFSFRNTTFMLLNVHLYFGSDHWQHKQRRALEAYAVGRYADLRRDDVHTFTENIIALGDFNIPMARKGDVIYDALSKRGLSVPEHSTKLASSISTDNQYDQVVFLPNLKSKGKTTGVFDYDEVIFPRLWETQPEDFKSYCRYYISDHRPMWVEMDFG